MEKQFRKGAIGALLDEYERAITDLKELINTIPDQLLPVIIDSKTSDENCKSMQSILTHVVNSAYGYATSIHNLKGHGRQRPVKVIYFTIKEYQDALDAAFVFTETIFKEFKEEEVEQLDNSLKIKTGWGQLYDIEQLMEHAIVHILRHRRQLEKIKMGN